MPATMRVIANGAGRSVSARSIVVTFSIGAPTMNESRNVVDAPPRTNEGAMTDEQHEQNGCGSANVAPKSDPVNPGRRHVRLRSTPAAPSAPAPTTESRASSRARRSAGKLVACATGIHHPVTPKAPSQSAVRRPDAIERAAGTPRYANRSIDKQRKNGDRHRLEMTATCRGVARRACSIRDSRRTFPPSLITSIGTCHGLNTRKKVRTGYSANNTPRRISSNVTSASANETMNPVNMRQ